MRNLVKLSLPLIMTLSVSISGTAWADVHKSHCIIYKNDRVVKQTNCNDNFTGWGHGGAEGTKSQFNIQGIGKITTETESAIWTPEEMQSNPPQQSGYYQRDYGGADRDDIQSWQWHKLNGKKSLKQRRDSSTLKIIPVNSIAQFEALVGTPTLINSYECYKQTQGNMEFCWRWLD